MMQRLPLSLLLVLLLSLGIGTPAGEYVFDQGSDTATLTLAGIEGEGSEPDELKTDSVDAEIPVFHLSYSAPLLYRVLKPGSRPDQLLPEPASRLSIRAPPYLMA